MNENKKLLVPLIILLMVLSGILGFLLKDLIPTTKENPKETEEVEKEKTTEKEDTTDVQAIKERINHFVEIGSYYSIGGYSLEKEFYNGLDSLNRTQKLQMAYIGNNNINQKSQKTEETPEKYKDDELFKYNGMGDTWIKEMLISDFEAEYKYLFNEEIGDYTAEEISGCPHPVRKDTELGKIYMSPQCGGTRSDTYEAQKIKEDKDDNYYYVYQKAGYNGDLKELVWKFDKKGNFVSTTNNG